METENNKNKLGIILLVISLLFIAFSTPFKNAGYFVGRLLAIIVPWAIILGIITYLIWRFGFKKREKLFLFIFSILFLLVALSQFAVDVFDGYVVNRATEIILSQPMGVQDGREFSDASSNFAITFPVGWEIKDGLNTKKAVKNVSPTEIAVISIAIENLESEVDITDKISEIKTLFEGMGLTVESINESIVNGNKSVAVRGIQDMPLGGKVRSLNYALTNGKRLYLISGTVDIDHFDKYESIFKDSITTFRFF